MSLYSMCVYVCVGGGGHVRQGDGDSHDMICMTIVITADSDHSLDMQRPAC
jgi:hypothetical protein